MRDDIVGMFKNAIEHGGNPSRVAQSLVNSGYLIKEVKEALDYVISKNPQLQLQQAPVTPQTQNPPKQSTAQMPQVPVYNTVPSPPLQPLKLVKPLPSQRTNPTGTGKILILVLILLLLVGSLISVIIFKDKILDLLSL